jgi:hypothetical protein
MKIIWNPNPLRTIVEIDDSDRERVIPQLQNEAYTDLISGLEYMIERGRVNSLEQVSEYLSKWTTIVDMTKDSEKIKELETYLQSEHAGDCTCIPCSCMKCYAEYILGICTTQGLGKHEGGLIQGAFGKTRDRSIDEAIESLRKVPDYRRPDSWPQSVDYERHIPRWEQERLNALHWLITYKETHGF